MATEPQKIELEQTLEQSGWLRALAVHLVGPDQAEDLMQDAWVKTLERPPRKSGARPQWMARVLTTLSLNSKRGEGRRRRREEKVSVGRASAVVAADETAAMLEVHEQVVQAVRSLREPYRTTIVMRFYEGLTTKQIAERFEIPPSTARNRLAKGLLELRRGLESRHGVGWRDATLGALFPYAGSLLPPVATGIALGTLMTTMKSKVLIGVGTLILLAGAFLWPDDLNQMDVDADGPLSAAVPEESALDGDSSPAGAPVQDQVEHDSLERAPAEAMKSGVQFRIVDESDTPIVGARVRAFISERQDKMLSRLPLDYFFPGMKADAVEHTNEHGVAFFQKLSPKRGWAFFVDAEGYASGVKVAEIDGYTDVLDLGELTLEPGLYLSLHLVDNFGQSVPHAKVYTRSKPTRLKFTIARQVRISDENGVVEFRGLPLSTKGIYTKPPGFVHFIEENIELTQKKIPPRRIELDRGGSIELLVLNSEGNPVADVEVYGESGGVGTPFVRLTVHERSFQGYTDAQGHFAIGGVKGNSHGIAIRKGQAWAAINSTRPGESITMQLPGVHEIRGRVLLKDGSPAEGAMLVIVNEHSPCIPPDFRVDLGANGEFKASLPSATYRLACWHETGGWIQAEGVPLTDDMDLGDLSLSPPTTLLLTIQDENGDSIGDARISPKRPESINYRKSFYQKDELHDTLIALGNPLFADSGKAVPNQPGVHRIAHLPAGNYPMSIYAPGFTAVKKEFQLIANQILEETIQLEATAELFLTVVDSSGKPVHGITMEVTPLGYSHAWRMTPGAEAPDRLPLGGFNTDINGIAHFPQVRTGDWEIGRWHEGLSGFFLGAVKIKPGVNHHTLQLPEELEVEFVVKGGNGPIENANVRISRKLSRPDYMNPNGKFSRGGSSGKTDRDGKWLVNEVEADFYRVQITAPGVFPIQEIVEIGVGSTSFHFNLDGASISGSLPNPPPGTQIILADFAPEANLSQSPVQHLQHHFWNSRPGSYVAVGGWVRYSYLSPMDDGNFQFEGLPPGTYYLLATAPGHVLSKPKEVVIEEQSVEHQELSLEEGGTVILQITGIAELTKKYPDLDIRVAAKGKFGIRIDSDHWRIEKDGDVKFSTVEVGDAEIILSFWNGDHSLPSVTIPVTVSAGNTTTIQWDASSMQ